jgi:N-acetylmuramoyl-L-alanine amidase
MKIRNHRLPGVAQAETPNKGGPIEPRYLVFHFTAGRSAKASIDWLCHPSAHDSGIWRSNGTGVSHSGYPSM